MSRYADTDDATAFTPLQSHMRYDFFFWKRGIDGLADGFGVMQRQLFARSERVKGIDFHPTEPWVSRENVLGMP